MKEESELTTTESLVRERHAWRARFLTRVARYKSQLKRRWWLLCLTTFLGLALATLARRFQPPLYVSSGRMIVNIKLSIPEGSLYTEELNNFLGTQAALMQSAMVIERAHERVGERAANIEPQTVALKAVILPRTTIFVLQGAGRNPLYTQTFVQACMEEYISLKKEMRTQTSDTTLAGMTEEIVRLEKELRQCDSELVSFSTSNSVLLLQEQGNSAANYLAGLNQRLAGLKSELSLLEVLDLDQAMERRQTLSSGLVPAVLHDPLESSSDLKAGAEGDYLHARQQVALLKSERDDLARYLRPKHPKMIALTEEIARSERLLLLFRQQSAEQLDSHKQSLKLQIGNLESESSQWEARALDMSRRSAEFQRLKANAQRIQALYDRLLATMQTLDVNKQISPESVTIMEKASPGLADRSGLWRKLCLGGLAGLGIGLALTVLLDRLDDRIISYDELRDLFDEEILAQIPQERSALSNSTPELLQPDDDRYAFVEAYRALRSSLLYMASPGDRPKTLLVTSSVPSEGKSLTSANLAVNFATAGARVLLVDADLRKGSLHSRFGLNSATPGLAEALSQNSTSVPASDPSSLTAASDGTSSWHASVRQTSVANLFLLPRGQTTPRASELFVGASATEFLRQAAEAYDFVILDTAPVLAADDVTSLAPRVDGVLFVVRAEKTSTRIARTALDLLYLRHVRVLGIVFNAVQFSNAGYYYGYP